MINIESLREKLSKLEKDLERIFLNGNLSKDDAYKLKEYNQLKDALKIYEEIQKIQEEIREYEELLELTEKPEEREYIQDEIDKLKREMTMKDMEFKRLLLVPDKEDIKNAVMEIRQGTGGEEAALFARDLMKMYLKYAEKKNWKVSIADIHQTSLGGVRFAMLIIEGDEAYRYLKYESGVHRVQRIPITESQGRIHTSTASVVVMPEAQDFEVVIKPEDLKIETFRAGGPGGQYVNVTDSAVRITHTPTGIVVSCQDERSQHKNKEKALRILRTRIYEKYREEQEEKSRLVRKSYIGTGERSEKIRTYNFPQNRVTDHRIDLTLYNLDKILEGELDELINSLLKYEEKQKIREIFGNS